LPGEREGLRIAVDAENANRRRALEERLCVTSRAQRDVHEETAPLRLEDLVDLMQQDRRVLASSFVFRVTTPSFTISRFEFRNSN